MNYQRIYDSIINNAKLLEESRKLQKKQKLNYFERHHILPKCLGGNNDKSNLVYLTAKEHYLCHRLLVEIYPENRKLKYAIWAMMRTNTEQRRYTPSCRIYAIIREEWLTAFILDRNTVESKKKISAVHKGKVVSESTRDKIRAARKLQIHYPKTLEQITKTINTKRRLGKLGHSGETKRRISAAKLGGKYPPMTAEHKRKIQTALKGKLRSKSICPHCTRLVSTNNQYHFDRCKRKPGNEHIIFIRCRSKKECPFCKLIVDTGNRVHFDNCKLKPGYVYVKRPAIKVTCTWCNKIVAKGNRYHFANCKKNLIL